MTSAPSAVSIPASTTATISVTKTSTTSAISAVGQVVTYTFVATNTGTVTLANVGITDTQTAPASALVTNPTCQSLTAPAATCSGATTTLAPGQSATFTATARVTQADLDNGSLDDSATATGTPPSGPAVTSTPATLSVPATQTATITVLKSASTSSVTTVGQVVTYTFVTKNTGNVTLSSVGVSDTQVAPAGALTTAPSCQSLAAPVGTCTGATTTLIPGQSATFTATATVTQADLDNGSLDDSAAAAGTPPTGPAVTSAPSAVTIAATTSASIGVTKTSSTTAIAAVGQVVTYTFVATNTGTVTLTNVAVTDTQAAPAAALVASPTCQSLAAPVATCSGATTTLAPGQSATFTASAAVTQADLDHGSLNDAATATGTSPTGSAVTSAQATLGLPATTTASVTVDKTSSSSTISAVGDVVAYSFVATNTGTVTLTNVGITDAQVAPAGALTTMPTCSSLSAPTGSCSGATTTLAPGQTATFTATATVTQADLDHGSLGDSATATARRPPARRSVRLRRP